jgi:hypothetical protein
MDVPRLVVLRLWLAPGHFRAVVRELGPEQTSQFDDPQALLRYLVTRPDDASVRPARTDASGTEIGGAR